MATTLYDGLVTRNLRRRHHRNLIIAIATAAITMTAIVVGRVGSD
jgi:hypothetical protein